DETGHLSYPVSGRDSAERGLGCQDNRHLSHLTEFFFVNVGGCYQDDNGAYLLVGGGHYVWEEAIESLVNPRQSEMKPMIEPHVAPAHTHPFEALLNQPLTGTFH